MAVKTVNRMGQWVEERKRLAASAVHQALILGGAEAASMTPQDTSTLIDSKYNRVEAQGTKVVGIVGYTAEYAAALHAKDEARAKGQPRPLRDGKPHGNFWDPRGETHFLAKGFKKREGRINAVIKRGMKG